MLGRTIGSYRIVGKLGEGGMGAVYAAEHALIGKRVAVKVLLPEYSKNTEIVQRFFNEAKAATRINHPGITAVFDFGFDADGAAYLVMELLDGEALSARLHRRGAMPPLQAIRLLRELSGALAAAHAQGIIHRDLKPDNVFIVPDPDVAGGERAKILDFGIAKLVDEAAAGAVKTRTGAVLGTPVYMSPEQCHGASVDRRTDLYSLGVIFFEMLTGRPPFVAEGIGDLMAMHMFSEPPLVRDLVLSLPSALDDLLGRLLAKRPDERFASASELIEAIDRILAAIPMESVEPRAAVPPSARSPRSARHTTLGGAAAQQIATVLPPRRRWILGAICVLCAGAAAVLATINRGPKEEEHAAAATAQPYAPPPHPPAATPDARASGPPATPPSVALAPETAATSVPTVKPPDAGTRAAVSPETTKAAPPTTPRSHRPMPPAEPPESLTQILAAEAAQARGDTSNAIAIARGLMHDPEFQVRAYRVMVLAFCQIHNAEASRSLYRGLTARDRGGLHAHCEPYGVILDP